MAKKIILPGIIAGVAILIAGLAVSYLFMAFPAVSVDYQNVALMRSWQDPTMSLFFLYPFILSMILSWVWNRSKSLFSGGWAGRGAKFGLVIWIISTVPGMFISYVSFPISLLTVISWTVGGLVNGIICGLIFSKMNS